MRIQSVIVDRAFQLAFSIALLCLILQLLDLREVLRFDRNAISAGQWWLLLTGNFVHLGTSHLLLNMAGFVLIVTLVWSNFTATQWLLVVIVCSLGVGTGLYLRDPDIGWYVGFSGTLHGLIIAGTLADIRRYPGSSIALLVLVFAKLAYEQYFGSVPGSESVAGGSVVVNSHLYGAITGLALGLILLASGGRKRSADKSDL